MSFASAVRKVMPTYGYSKPGFADTVQELSRTKFTPDISKLEEYEWQHIFAIDELKKDHTHHRLLGPDAEFVFPAFTQKGYRFWDTGDPTKPPVATEAPLGPQPIVGFPPVAKIKGQVWKIRPQRFLELDIHKRNTLEFFRRRVRLIVPYRSVVFVKDHTIDPTFGLVVGNSGEKYTGSSIKHTEETVYIIQAWMYIGKPEFWDSILSPYTCSSIERFHSSNRNWCKTYYHIRRPELPPK